MASLSEVEMFEMEGCPQQASCRRPEWVTEVINRVLRKQTESAAGATSRVFESADRRLLHACERKTKEQRKVKDKKQSHFLARTYTGR